MVKGVNNMKEGIKIETIYALPAADAIHNSITAKRNGYLELIPCERRSIAAEPDPCKYMNKSGTPICLYADNKDDIGTKGLIHTANGLECPLQRGKLQAISQDHRDAVIQGCLPIPP